MLRQRPRRPRGRRLQRHRRLALLPLLACSTLALVLGAGRGAIAATAGERSDEEQAVEKGAPPAGQPPGEDASAGKAADPPAPVALEVVNLTYVPSKVRPTGGDEAGSAPVAKAVPEAKAAAAGGPDARSKADQAASPPPGARAAAGAAAPAPPPGDSVDDLVAALNAMFPSPPSPETAGAAGAGGGNMAPPVARRLSSRTLLLRANPRQLGGIRRILDRTDVPWPQVQLDLWAIEISGRSEQVGDEVNRISMLIGETRDQLVAVQRALVKLVSVAGAGAREPAATPPPPATPGASDLPPPCTLGTIYQYVRAHRVIDFPREEPMSLHEALILLILRGEPERQATIDALRQVVVKRRAEARARRNLAAGQCRRHDDERAGQADARDGSAPKDGGTSGELQPFRRLQELLADTSPQAECRCLSAFLQDAVDVENDRLRPDAEANTDAYREERRHASDLVRQSVRVDRLVQSVMDAFVADIAELYFNPLLQDIRDGGGCARDDVRRRGEGVALSGRTHMVVTSGLESDLEPEMASFVETTRPAPFGKDLLDQAFGNDTSTGSGRILASLPQGKAALLAGALLSETPPTYSKVAPGIAVHVRPTVLPDGSAARLTIDARFGVTTADYDPKDQDVRMQPPPPGIASHHVSTDAAVSAFDLFDISSFTVDTAVPRAPFVVPILGRLPILGGMFQFRRDNVTTRHESMILVNTAILPRSLALLSYYQAGRPTDSPRVSGAHATAPP